MQSGKIANRTFKNQIKDILKNKEWTTTNV